MSSREDYYWVRDLKPHYDKLPDKWTGILNIGEGALEVSSWKQFISFYSDRPLRYEKSVEGLEEAGSRLIQIFFDNLFILEQIKNNLRLLEQLNDFGNWQTNTNLVSVSSSDNDNTYSNFTNILTTNNFRSLVDSVTGQSDANSYAQGRQANIVTDQRGNKSFTFPVNLYSGNIVKTENSISDKVDNSVVGKSLNKMANQAVTKTSVTNPSEDIRAYFKIRLPQLRRMFWSKFAPLFY